MSYRKAMIYERVTRSRQMLGNRITARLCACRCVVDDADGGLSSACIFLCGFIRLLFAENFLYFIQKFGSVFNNSVNGT